MSRCPGTPKAIRWLKMRFETSTMVITNVTTFGVAVGVAVLAVDVEDQNRFDDKMFIIYCKARSELSNPY